MIRVCFPVGGASSNLQPVLEVEHSCTMNLRCEIRDSLMGFFQVIKFTLALLMYWVYYDMLQGWFEGNA